MASSPNDVSFGVGLSDPKYSSRRRGMHDVINRMRNTGVQGDIDLPEIAVVGSQSAGKSSLIESISGITLPRASNTCTRCPTECRLSRSSGKWTCKVSLRFHIGPNGAPLDKTTNTTFGGPIYDRDDVEDRLRRAQLAILNSSLNALDFLGDDYDRSQGVAFSANCIVLDIAGPEYDDLTFIDLPGLIVTAGSGGGSNEIGLVRSLVLSYIKKPSCIILLTVTCETDFMNQGAYELARQMDPEGKRTVGVLTKPDRIPYGDENIWISLIKNEDRPLKNNWFCVKQPGAKELAERPGWKQARAQEAEYFSSTAHWTELDPLYQEYLRTENLTIRLSGLLSDLIAKRLPEIQKEIDAKLDETRKLLQQLPPKASDDPFSDIIALLHGFTSDIEQHVKGIPKRDGFLQLIRPEHEKFRRRIRETAPNFRPYERKLKGKKHLPSTRFLSQDGEEDEGSEPELSDAPSALKEEQSEKETEEEEDIHAAMPGRVVLTSPIIYINQVASHAKMAQTRELPGNHPFVVQQELIDKVTEKWKAPSQELCTRVHSLILARIKPIITERFEFFGDGQLAQALQVLMQKRSKGLLEETCKRVDWLHDLEHGRAFTLNHHYLAAYLDKFTSFFKECRYNDKLPSSLRGYGLADTTNRRDALSALARLGIHNVEDRDLAKLLPYDMMEPYIKIMAEVRAYFQVAYKRFVDIVPLAVDQEFLQGLKKNIHTDLCHELGLYGPDGSKISKEYARESPQLTSRRAELLKRIERLSTASEELMRM